MLAKTKNMNIRINEDEYDNIKRFADFSGKTISALMLDAVREQIDYWEDLKDIEEYEKAKENGTLVTYTMQEAKERLGL
ncbi:MAG: DUF1778 domain-containing protein [Lachnospiraceae bacterium]|nr:DUF1778 domain-containing protein [Lachnospiraceae bacterium]